MSTHAERRRSYLAKLTAEFLSRRAGPQSLITVIDFFLSPDGKSAEAKIGVWPDAYRQTALTFVNRQTRDWHEFVAERTKFRPLPRLKFSLKV